MRQNTAKRYFINNKIMEEKNKKGQLESGEPKAETVTIEMAEYEGLRTENVKLRANIQNAFAQMKEMNDVIIEKRISFLFRVIENAVRFSDEFVAYCASEIEEALWSKEEEKKDE